MDGRSYKNHRVIDAADLRCIATEMRAISRAKTTPELTKLQFAWAVKAIEKLIDGSDLLLPMIKQVEIESIKKAKEKIIKNKKDFKKYYNERKKVLRKDI